MSSLMSRDVGPGGTWPISRVQNPPTISRIPPLNEVAGKISRWLANNLHGNIMPRHFGNLGPVVHILIWLIEPDECLFHGTQNTCHK